MSESGLFTYPPLPPTLIAWYLNIIFACVLPTKIEKFDSSQPLFSRFFCINYHIECWLLWRSIFLFKIRHNVYKLALCSRPKSGEWSSDHLGYPSLMHDHDWVIIYCTPPPPLWAKVSIWDTLPSPLDRSRDTWIAPYDENFVYQWTPPDFSNCNTKVCYYLFYNISWYIPHYVVLCKTDEYIKDIY